MLRTLWKWMKRVAALGLSLGVIGVIVAIGTYFYFDRDLPSVEQLKTYKPPQVTKVYCADGSVCAEFYRERRTWVDINTLPPHVKNAFLAAEDADFYHHQGLDYVGMLRAAIKAGTGGKMTGASTITQQVVKNILLTQERTLSRKIREWILTPRLERALTKDQILNLYVNQIYFGHNRYGIEEAALFYFGKHAKDLTIGEAAVLAGTPQSPHRINPLTNIVRAKQRQRYVLSQLAEHGFVPKEVIAQELDKPIVLAPRPPPRVGAYYVEEVRRALVERYGEQAVLEGGMRVEIALVPRFQAAADAAVQQGLEALDRRMGYRGALGTFDPKRFDALRPLIATRIAEAGRRRQDEVLIADLMRLTQPDAAGSDAESLPLVASGEDSEAIVESGRPGTAVTRSADGGTSVVAAPAALSADEDQEPPPSPDERLARDVALRPLHEGARVVGYVTRVDDRGRFALVDLVSRTARIDFDTVTWARPRGVGKSTAPPKKMSDVLHPGDLIRIRVGAVGKAKDPAQPLEATLDQIPEVQGALVAIDPSNRHVVAMTGGYDFELSPFNRATQARRQPGSAFKPFVYGAALDSRRYTPLSVVNDAPEAIRDPWTGKLWKPRNYENGFDGPMTLRAALTQSKNTVSVRLIEALTPQVVIDFARRGGIHADLPENLTLALGTGEVQVLDLANAYATLQSLGRYADPITVIRVIGPDGRVLEEHQPAFTEALPPATAYLTTSLMQSVVEMGTATAVKSLGRPAAGKTGTANDYRDAWFSGYTTDYVATAWVGFDDHSSLGHGETGSRAALPIWLDFMKAAHEGLPVRDFEVPPGVEFVRIDPLSGLLAGSAVPGRIEPFLEGTAPTAEALPPDTARPEDFFMLDQRGGL
ncbi:MAG: PBP1A family penicillin-binding protein [Myxococcaceae bacterium]|nr:PBP1A family penicillin-binding protein [Myxococcaceae bacterium]